MNLHKDLWRLAYFYQQFKAASVVLQECTTNKVQKLSRFQDMQGKNSLCIQINKKNVYS